MFWFNVPLALLGSLWACTILRELAKPDSVRGYDVPGVTIFVLGLTGLVYGLSRGGLSGWTDPLTLGGIVAGVVLLPLFVLIERHHRAPMLDLTIFQNRLFAAATGGGVHQRPVALRAAVPVRLLLPGRQGPGPDHRGHRAGADGHRDADRLAAGRASGPTGAGRARWPPGGWSSSALALAGMTTLGVHTAYFWSALWLFIVGVGSGMFNSPNTAAMMGTVPTYRRGIAAGARTMLQNTGAVISIAFVLAIVTSSVPKETLFKIFSGVSYRAVRARRSTRSSPTCTRRCGCWRRRRWSAPRSRCCGRKGD